MECCSSAISPTGRARRTIRNTSESSGWRTATSRSWSSTWPEQKLIRPPGSTGSSSTSMIWTAASRRLSPVCSRRRIPLLALPLFVAVARGRSVAGSTARWCSPTKRCWGPAASLTRCRATIWTRNSSTTYHALPAMSGEGARQLPGSLLPGPVSAGGIGQELPTNQAVAETPLARRGGRAGFPRPPP